VPQLLFGMMKPVNVFAVTALRMCSLEQHQHAVSQYSAHVQ